VTARKGTRPERIRRTESGWPNITKAQAERVEKYAADVWEHGTSTRDVSTLLLCATVIELSAVVHGMGAERDQMRARLRELADERSVVIPVSHVATLAIALLAKVSTITDEGVRDAFLHELTHSTGTFVIASPLGAARTVPLVPTDPSTKH